jgi:hypothetical protein
MAWAIYWTMFLATIGASGFAIVKGDASARWAGVLRLSTMVLEFCVQSALVNFLPHNNVWIAVDDLADTAIVSFGFLYIATRYASPWLAAAMVIQGTGFYVDRVFLDVNPGDHQAFVLQENLITIGVAACLFFATLSAIRQRRKRRLADVERRQKDEARAARIEALLSNRYGVAA